MEKLLKKLLKTEFIFKMKKIISVFLFFFVTHLYSQINNEKLEVKLESNTSWWAGIIIEGHKMPLKNGYEAIAA